MTSDGQALLRAVCENPDDDLPRLVYADWLEEHGRGDRAEFIRLKCEARGYADRFPSLTAARNRASELERAHRHEWLAELPGLPQVEWGGLWVRGFIDSATIDVRDATPDVTWALLDAVFDAAPVVRLGVVEVRSDTLRAVVDFPRLGRLRSLSLVARHEVRSATRLLAEARRRLPGRAVTFEVLPEPPLWFGPQPLR